MSKDNISSKTQERIKRLEDDIKRYKDELETLKREKKTLESLIRHSFLGIVTVDENLRVTSCNREFEKLFQYKKSEIVGKNLDEVISKDRTFEEARKFSERTLNGSATHGSGIRYRKDGTPIPVEFFAVPAIVDGKVVGAYGIYQDISEREEISRALKASEERYRSLVDMSPMGIGVYGLDGRILFVNKAAIKISGA
ncbi:MAG: PAS domain S-box protein, partial [Deltaproteobacteria bacterium]|nr:PAS domain S-box protein [Deltaproteobacteria bacterium]